MNRKNRIFFISVFLSALFFICAGTLHAKEKKQYKKVEIQGLRIFTPEELSAKCDLKNFPINQSAYKEAARRINNYYYKRGYYLAITYRVEETSHTLTLFVDEGKIGQIIFKGLSDIALVRMKADFTLNERIYNRAQLDRELDRLKTKYGFKNMKMTLSVAKDYSENFVQLDGVIQLPFLSDSQIPLFEQYGYRYNLIIEPSSYTKGEVLKKTKGVKYGLKFSYFEITPKVRYRYPDLFTKNDSAEISASCGLSYLGDFNPLNPPALTNIQGSTLYNFVPMFDSFFTPRIRTDGYYSKNGRPDIGLTSYDFIRSSGAVEPGVTLLSQFKIFIGNGFEKIFLFKTKTDDAKNHTSSIIGDTRLWYTFSVRVELESYFGMLFPAMLRDINAKYMYYFDGVTFHQFEVNIHTDFNARKLDILSVNATSILLIGNVPFYHEQAVSDSVYFGLSGRGFYTRQAVKAGVEYITSIYRDYIFIGPFLHGVYFKGSGYDLHGPQFAGAAGLTGRYIFWDQFEARIYAGRDYLVSENTSGFNMAISAEKKF